MSQIKSAILGYLTKPGIPLRTRYLTYQFKKEKSDLTRWGNRMDSWVKFPGFSGQNKRTWGCNRRPAWYLASIEEN